MTDKYKIIDLFCGCGGFSQGFIKAGFEVVAASEFWDPAIETYKKNHHNVKVIEGDISLPEKKQELYESINEQKINVIIGGPPCQGYSVAGNRDPNDPRGQLYLDYIEIVDHLKPDFFVMENVKGLQTMRHVRPNLKNGELKEFKENCTKLQRYKDLKRYSAQRRLEDDEKKEFGKLKSDLKNIKAEIDKYLYPLINKILAKFEEVNYNVVWKVLNSANYGVPQTRERIIFIGTKHQDIKISFPIPTHSNKTNQKSLTSFLKDNSNLIVRRWITAEEGIKKYENWSENPHLTHIFTQHSKKFVQKMKNTPPGKNVFEHYTDSFWRLEPNRPARTVKENHGGVFVHYKFNRVCTPRELAALQSFDDSFLFEGSKSSILKQIGNAVPPLMSAAIAKSVKKSLDMIYKRKGKV